MGVTSVRAGALGGGFALACLVALPACHHRPALSLPDPAKIDLGQPEQQKAVKDRTDGCVSCHTGQTDPHPLPQDPSKAGRFAHLIGCTDCHGGDATLKRASEEPGSRRSPRRGRPPATPSTRRR
jgi:hypothetical protein